MRGGGAIGPGYGRRGTNRGGTDLCRRRLGRYVGPRSPFNFTFFSWALGVKGVSFAGDGQVGGKRSGIHLNGLELALCWSKSGMELARCFQYEFSIQPNIRIEVR